MLTEDHRRQRVVASREFFERHAQEGEDLSNSIVTGDEAWIYRFTRETKIQFLERRHSASPKKRRIQADTVSEKNHDYGFFFRAGKV